MTLGELIKAYREEHGLSGREFAKLAHLSNTMIANYERDVSLKTGEPLVPSLGSLVKIADAMGLTIDELLGKCEGTIDTVAIRDASDYRGSNYRIAKLVAIANGLSAKNLKELVSYAEYLEGRQ